MSPPRLYFGPPGSDSERNFEQNLSEFVAKSFANILGNPNMRIAAYTVFYDTKRMSELGRGSPTPLQNPPECALKATIAFLLLLHRLWTLQNGPLGVSSGLMGVPRATSGDFWTPLGALLGSLGHSWGPLWRPKNPQISEKSYENSKKCCLLGFRASFSCPPDDLKWILDPPRWILDLQEAIWM